MKFSFRASSQPHTPISRKGKMFLFCGFHTLRKSRYTQTGEPIEFAALFEFAALPDGSPETSSKRRKKKKADRTNHWLIRLKKRTAHFFSRARDFFLGFFSALGTAIRDRLSRLRNRPKKKKSPYPLFGACCAALLVLMLCAATVLYAFSRTYGGFYKTVTVPDLVGRPFDADEYNSFSYIIRYENNPDIPAGYVISQTPNAGVTRRLYGKDNHCTLTVAVSKEKEPYHMVSLAGIPEREATLELRTHGITVRRTEAHSDSVAAGCVISTSSVPGEVLSPGKEVTLTVSLGAIEIQSIVPNLLELTEMQAITLLETAGLTAGTISYRTSSLPIGSVIGQEYAAGTRIVQGTAVSFTVSSGKGYVSKTMPDLYGLSLEEAKQKLREYGIVIGTIIPVSSATPEGTVVSQTPAPGTPITSSVISVDVYVSM